MELRPSRKVRMDILSGKNDISPGIWYRGMIRKPTPLIQKVPTEQQDIWWGSWSGDNRGRMGDTFSIRLRNCTLSCGQ